MHLQNSHFYSILSSTFADQKLQANISINKEHDIFKGHFTHQPVLPGVCMLQISKEILEQHYQCRVIMPTSGQIKFLKMVDPNVDSSIFIEIKKIPEALNNTPQFINIDWKDNDGNFILKLNGGYSVAQ